MLIAKISIVQVKEVMVLYFIKRVIKFQEIRPVSKRDVFDIFIKLVVVWWLFPNISPKHYVRSFLIITKSLHYEHDVLDVIWKLLDGKLIIILQGLSLKCYQMNLESVDIQINRLIRIAFSWIKHSFCQYTRLMNKSYFRLLIDSFQPSVKFLIYCEYCYCTRSYIFVIKKLFRFRINLTIDF